MKTFIFVSIFPEIYDSFLNQSLIGKAQARQTIKCICVNPRDFCKDRHRQVDDVVYGGGVGMLIKAQPMIDTIKSIIANIESGQSFLVVHLTPSVNIFSQQYADLWAKNFDVLIFVSGRYEGIDDRFSQRMQKTYPANFITLSLGRFVLLGGEVASMVMTEAVARLCPDVIGDSESMIDESYSIQESMSSLEYPQYTRPQDVEGFVVPEVLISGHHAQIEQWKKANKIRIS